MPKTKSRSGKRSKRRQHHEIPKESVFDPKTAYDQCINHLEQLYHEACGVSPAKAADTFQVVYGFIKMMRNNHKRNGQQNVNQYRIAIPEKKFNSKPKEIVSASKPIPVQAPIVSYASPDAPLLDDVNVNETVVNVMREAINRVNRPCSRTFERFANSRRQITIDSLIHSLEEMELNLTPYDAGCVIAHYDFDNQGYLDLPKFEKLFENNRAAATMSNPGDTSVPKKEEDIIIAATTDAEIILLKQIERILIKEPFPLSQTYHKICGTMGESRITPAVLHEVLKGHYGLECNPSTLEKAISRYDKTTWGLSKSEFVRMLSHAKLA